MYCRKTQDLVTSRNLLIGENFLGSANLGLNLAFRCARVSVRPDNGGGNDKWRDANFERAPLPFGVGRTAGPITGWLST